MKLQFKHQVVQNIYLGKLLSPRLDLNVVPIANPKQPGLILQNATGIAEPTTEHVKELSAADTSLTSRFPLAFFRTS